MKIKRKDLKRLIENYLFEQDEEAESEEGSEGVTPSEEEAESEEVPEDELPEESDESEGDESEGDEEPKEEEPDENSVATSDVVKKALQGLDIDSKPLDALKKIKLQVDSTFKGMEIKIKDIPEEILKFLKLDKKDPEEVANLNSAVNNAGLIRKAVADQQGSK